MPDPASRLRAAAIALPIGAVAGAGTAVLAGLSRPVEHGIFAAVVAAAATAIVVPAIHAHRPVAWVALAVVMYPLGVLAYPPSAFALGLDPPFGGPSGVELRDILPMYAFLPVGFFIAAPFAPAVALAAVAIATVVQPPVSPQEEGAGRLEATLEADRRFQRRTLVAAGVLIVGIGLGYVLLAMMAGSLGY
jgi:hypothetical protein